LKIIGGTAGGRRLATPEKRSSRSGPGRRGELIRPTSALAREALFNILGPAVADGEVADLYAGSGALGLEALSRGARSALFVDLTREAVNLIHENIDRCGFGDRARVVKRDLARGLFFCPPWLRPAASP